MRSALDQKALFHQGFGLKQHQMMVEKLEYRGFDMHFVAVEAEPVSLVFVAATPQSGWRLSSQ